MPYTTPVKLPMDKYLSGASPALVRLGLCFIRSLLINPQGMNNVCIQTSQTQFEVITTIVLPDNLSQLQLGGR